MFIAAISGFFSRRRRYKRTGHQPTQKIDLWLYAYWYFKVRVGRKPCATMFPDTGMQALDTSMINYVPSALDTQWVHVPTPIGTGGMVQRRIRIFIPAKYRLPQSAALVNQ